MIEHTQPGCVFCQIIAEGKDDYDLDYAVAIFPLNPVTDGHTLIVPKLHVTDALDDELITAETMRCAVDYVKYALLQPLTDVNFITSVGAAATQTVFHLHIHVVPRLIGDGLPLPWTPQHAAQQTALATVGGAA